MDFDDILGFSEDKLSASYLVYSEDEPTAVLFSKLEYWDESYRNGSAVVPDSLYDELYDYIFNIDPDNDFFHIMSREILDADRKSKLPVQMRSMNKIKTVEEYNKYINKKGLKSDTRIIITPKYDGLSFCTIEQEAKAWTRGDGEYGNSSDAHYLNMDMNRESILPGITYGEVIMKNAIFNAKYSTRFSNPRNLVGGIINSNDVTDKLKDVLYIRYGHVNDTNYVSKSQIIDTLNNIQTIKVPYVIIDANEFDDTLALALFKEWSKEFTIDGLIIEVNSIRIQAELGRESNNNPAYAVAYKSSLFEQVVQTDVLYVEYNISKQGKLKPIIKVRPVLVDGVTISNVTGNNAKFIKENNIGAGSIITIKRSGMVIPKVVSVVKPVEFELPDLGVKIGWDKTNTELICLERTEEQEFMQIVSFFDIIGVDEVSEGILRKIWDAGYKDLKSILNMSVTDFMSIDTFGERRASIVYSNIQKRLVDIPLSKLQHATSLFPNLGSKKLVLLEQFTTKPTITEVKKIAGFSDISASNYIDNYDSFFELVKELPVSYVVKERISGDLDGRIFVFTGFRDIDLEMEIESRGGKIGSSVSKKTTYLITANKGGGTSKEEKALALGVTVFDRNEIVDFLKK